MKQSFTAQIDRTKKRAEIRIPFDPNEAWGHRDRHHITGTVGGRKVRGELKEESGTWQLHLGPAWIRDNPVPEAPVEIELSPEGPTLAPDLTQALDQAPEAKEFFESLPTFYRNNYVRWIEQAKRPETRAKRISETLELCAANKRERQ
ncbi:YdeI/OmpD-associated family protein [soil metagenome]